MNLLISTILAQDSNIGNAFNSPIGREITVGRIVSILVSAGITIAGVILLFLLVGGGLMMISSAGNDDPRGAAQGKQAVTWAIVGFIIVITAFWVIRIFEIITGYEFLTAPTFGGAIGGGGSS